jgi:hypothetical protein
MKSVNPQRNHQDGAVGASAGGKLLDHQGSMR